jgi:outer membrane murein-binding lipoprotein Lpp
MHSYLFIWKSKQGDRQMKRLLCITSAILCLTVISGCYASKKKEPDLSQSEISKQVSSHSSNLNASSDTFETQVNNSEETSIQVSEHEPGFYSNSRYGFSIHYPNEWTPSDESPAGDGIILNEIKENDIRVYGGYIANDFIDKQIQQYKSDGYEISDLITDQGEKGKLIVGKDQDKLLFHFIILGKELQCQFYALVTKEYFNANEATLLKTAKQLFLGEVTDFTTYKDSNKLTSYQKYLNDLLPQHVRNIVLAENNYKDLVTDDKAMNDKFFRLFRVFYTKVISENESYFSNGGKEISEDLVLQYGLRISGSESGDFIAEDPNYLPTHFSSTLSDGLKEFLHIRKKHYDQYPATYLIEDAALSVSWDQLSDRFIDWENYINRYPKYEETKEAEGDLGFCLDLYLLDFHLDNTPMFEQGVLSEELQSSYTRFMKQYPNSKYYAVIKGYYDIISKNKYKLTKDATNVLARHGIKMESGDSPETKPGVEITEKDFKIGNIELYMKPQDVKNAMGKEPIEITDKTDESGKTVRMKYDDGTEIVFLVDQVCSIFVVSPGYITPRGLAVGDSLEKVFELYGQPLSKDGPVWDYEGLGEYDMFHVYVKDDRVTGIMVNLVM